MPRLASGGGSGAAYSDSNQFMGSTKYDAIVVGSGPNGLAAAIRLAQRQLSVLVLEASNTIGGGTRSAALTCPEFVHDVCSAVQPLAIASPFLRTLGLEKHGLAFIHPELPLVHTLEPQEAVAISRSLPETAQQLGRDGKAYRKLFETFANKWEQLAPDLLKPLLHWPKHPWLMAQFGFVGLSSATKLATRRFETAAAKALFAGLAAHSILPLEETGSAAFGVVLGATAHAVGWPFVRGGSQQLANAMASCLRSLGGVIQTSTPVEDLAALPPARAVLLNIAPRQFLRLAPDKLQGRYRRTLERFRYGPGVFKIDYALNAPIPWKSDCCRRAGTVHVGGSLEQIATAEREVANGEIPEKPFLLLAQPTLWDTTRTPAGKHTAWVYCHVPANSTVDMTDRIERQIERYAPGFRDVIAAKHTLNCGQMEAGNRNYVGGHINGGAADLRQLFARPVLSPTPYRTPLHGVYLCSSSTPPGGGVHGMCGYHAAETAIRDLFH